MIFTNFWVATQKFDQKYSTLKGRNLIFVSDSFFRGRFTQQTFKKPIVPVSTYRYYGISIWNYISENTSRIGSIEVC